jgi:hypothetical protein
MSSTHPCSTRSRQLPPPYGTRDAAHRGLEVQPIILTYPLTMAACHKEPLGSWRAGVRVNKGLGPGRRGSRYLHKPYTWEKGACGRMTTGGDCGQLPRECLPPPQAAGTPGREEWEAGDPQTRMVGSLAFRVAKSVETHCMEEDESRTFLQKLWDDRQLAGRVAFWLVVVVVWSALRSLREARLLRARLRG